MIDHAGLFVFFISSIFINRLYNILKCTIEGYYRQYVASGMPNYFVQPGIKYTSCLQNARIMLDQRIYQVELPPHLQ